MRLILALVMLLLAPVAGWAQSCSVTVDHPLSFGNYLPSSLLPNDTTANVTVTCNAVLALGINYSIKLQSASNRVMNGPKGTLSYVLATDPLFTDPWPEGRSVNGTILLTLLNLLGTRVHPVWGRLASGQYAGSGSYTDSLMVVVTY